ncbi:hypothetical protein HK102_006597 [Quaeritorhiza haematococci]|nr:hypothetical protein HK102_006597 [Quaeritorhiza haematococci]
MACILFFQLRKTTRQFAAMGVHAAPSAVARTAMRRIQWMCLVCIIGAAAFLGPQFVFAMNVAWYNMMFVSVAAAQALVTIEFFIGFFLMIDMGRMFLDRGMAESFRNFIEKEGGTLGRQLNLMTSVKTEASPPVSASARGGASPNNARIGRRLSVTTTEGTETTMVGEER